MAVLIKDMKFPANCNGCKFNQPYMSQNLDVWTERILNYKSNFSYMLERGKPDWCPLAKVEHITKIVWNGEVDNLTNNKRCTLWGENHDN